jgi:hypothetical protein
MSPVAPWSAHDTQLLFSVSLGLAIIIGLISGFKIVPFFSILIGTFVTGLVAGVPADKLGFNFTEGAGQLLGDAGIIIALGAMLGALLAESGAAGSNRFSIAAARAWCDSAVGDGGRYACYRAAAVFRGGACSNGTDYFCYGPPLREADSDDCDSRSRGTDHVARAVTTASRSVDCCQSPAC